MRRIPCAVQVVAVLATLKLNVRAIASLKLPPLRVKYEALFYSLFCPIARLKHMVEYNYTIPKI